MMWQLRVCARDEELGVCARDEELDTCVANNFPKLHSKPLKTMLLHDSCTRHVIHSFIPRRDTSMTSYHVMSPLQRHVTSTTSCHLYNVMSPLHRHATFIMSYHVMTFISSATSLKLEVMQ